MSATIPCPWRATPERALGEHSRPAPEHRRRASGLCADPQVGARPRAQRAGVLRRASRGEPLLGHGRDVPVRVPDDIRRRRPVRRASDDRSQHPAGRERDRRRPRRQQRGDAISSIPITTPITPARPRCSAGTSSASGTRRRGSCCSATTTPRGLHQKRPSTTAAPSRSEASASSWPGTAPITRRTTSSSICPTTTR